VSNVDGVSAGTMAVEPIFESAERPPSSERQVISGAAKSGRGGGRLDDRPQGRRGCDDQSPQYRCLDLRQLRDDVALEP
jgi:hypothetical protein